MLDTYHVILPDLQAHGANAQDEGRDYTIKGQVDFLDELFEVLDADTFHIGGSSIGGHTAAAYTFHHQDKAKSLTVLNATGMQLEQESVYLSYPESVDQEFFDEMFARVFFNPPAFPQDRLPSPVPSQTPRLPS